TRCSSGDRSTARGADRARSTARARRCKRGFPDRPLRSRGARSRESGRLRRRQGALLGVRAGNGKRLKAPIHPNATVSRPHLFAAQWKQASRNSVVPRLAVCGSRDLVTVVDGSRRCGARETRPRCAFELGNISAAIGFLPFASSATQIEGMRALVMRRRIILSRGQAVDDPGQRNRLPTISAKDSAVVLNLGFLTHSDLVWVGVMQSCEETKSYTGVRCASIPNSSPLWKSRMVLVLNGL